MASIYVKMPKEIRDEVLHGATLRLVQQVRASLWDGGVIELDVCPLCNMKVGMGVKHKCVKRDNVIDVVAEDVVLLGKGDEDG